jgi:hypothetical protein
MKSKYSEVGVQLGRMEDKNWKGWGDMACCVMPAEFGGFEFAPAIILSKSHEIQCKEGDGIRNKNN